MKVYTIINDSDEYGITYLVGKPEVYFTPAKARKAAEDFLKRVWQRPFGMEMSMDGNGNEVTKYVGRDSLGNFEELCKVIGMEVKI